VVALSAVDGGHARFVVAFAGGGREVVEPFDLAAGEFDAVGGGVLLDAGDAPGAGDRGDVVAVGEEPGQAICAGVAAASSAMALTSATKRRLRWTFSPMKRALLLRQSSSGMSSAVRIWPVRKPCPSGE
jgi:hypothetical protein